ncbi:MAG: 4'-phosphopantetheinyl transferase superfamily protein [Actinomycetota bacterium]|nr:4'-phosphopantetheinyl transferase superfamily protein [Actinomycetota bacterium]
MVGNDVVDLADVDADASTYSSRFDDRVFTADEQRWIDAAVDPSRARWEIWAAKEAAYKAVKRDRPSTVFSPSAFEVELDAHGSCDAGGLTRSIGVVRGAGSDAALGDGECLRVEVESNVDRVHAVARRDGEVAPDFEVAMLPAAGDAGDIDPSAFVRRRLVRKLAAALGVPTARLTLDRRKRVPIVLLDGREIPIEASLSHHGRFVACAWSQRGVRRTRPLVRSVARRAREVSA